METRGQETGALLFLKTKSCHRKLCQRSATFFFFPYFFFVNLSVN